MSKIGNNIIVLPKDLNIQQYRTTKYVFLFISGYYKKIVVCLSNKYICYKQKNLLIIRPFKNWLVYEKKMWGLYLRMLFSLFKSIEVGVSICLKLSGVGFRVNIINKKLVFFLGYSHVKEFILPENIYVKILNKNETEIMLFGFDKKYLSQIVAQIKLLKVPDLYKGKGIFLFNEKIKLKQGKQLTT